MGGGSWTTDDYKTFASTTYRASVSSDGSLSGTYSAGQLYRAEALKDSMNPYKIIRECADTEEHPHTKPVILALDVTGSMGDTAVEIAKKLNVVMTNLYESVEDVEFCVMGIGDLHYDGAPIQMSQFESDIRIAESIDDIYFEFGGGGNKWESYTAAWYMGAYHTKLDCLERGEKGIIITIGDERLNPHLPKKRLAEVTGDSLQAAIATPELYMEAIKKFDLYHIDVYHNGFRSEQESKAIRKSFQLLDEQQRFASVKTDEVADAIIDIICGKFDTATGASSVQENENGDIVW